MGDGWRHLRFLLVHSPTHLFIVPAAVMLALGALDYAHCDGRVDIFGRQWDVHTLIAGSLLCIVGVQVIALGLCAHAYGTYYLGEKDPWFDRMRARFRLENGLLLGGAIMVVGFAVAAVSSVCGLIVALVGLSEIARSSGCDVDRNRDPDFLLVLPNVDHWVASLHPLSGWSRFRCPYRRCVEPRVARATEGRGRPESCATAPGGCSPAIAGSGSLLA